MNFFFEELNINSLFQFYSVGNKRNICNATNELSEMNWVLYSWFIFDYMVFNQIIHISFIHLISFSISVNQSWIYNRENYHLLNIFPWFLWFVIHKYFTSTPFIYADEIFTISIILNSISFDLLSISVYISASTSISLPFLIFLFTHNRNMNRYNNAQKDVHNLIRFYSY